jgi:hypothetical protein
MESKEHYTMKNKLILAVTVVLFAAVLTIFGSNNDTIQTCIISNSSYSTQNEIESVKEVDTLISNEPIYTCIHVVESPKGMEYTVKWYLDGTEVKSETKATVNDMQDIIVYELENEQAVEGTLKVEVIYKDTTLLTKELKIQ